MNIPVEPVSNTEATIDEAPGTERDGDAPPAADPMTAPTALVTEDTDSSGSTEHDDGSALAKLRRLVRDRTRFDDTDVNGVNETCVAQGLTIDATHALEARLESVGITGRSQPTGKGAQPSRSAITDAASDTGHRLNLGLDLLYTKLQNPATVYDELRDGLWLPAEAIHVELHRCSPCYGKGRVTCYTCSGSCTEICYNCGGAGRTSCTWCSSTGKVMCTRCSGTSTVTVGSMEYYTEQVWLGDRYDSQTKSRWVEKQVACNCSYGRVNCSYCVGQGRIGCVRCSTTGTITCRTCTGMGDLVCEPCEGSGRVGTAAWVEVHHKVKYGQNWLSPIDQRANEIGRRADVHAIASESGGLALAELHRTKDGMSGAVLAGYRGELDVLHLDVTHGEQNYHVVAYGVNRQWLDLNHIIRDLLNGDLEALRSALVSADTSGHAKARKERLTGPLRDVVESELNTALVEATLDGRSLVELHTLVSADYAEKLKDALLSALKRIYDDVAMHTWWQMPLVCSLVALATWQLNHPYWAMLPAVCALPMSLGLLHFQSSRVFESTLGDQARSDKALQYVRKAKHHRKGLWLHLLPSLLVLALSVVGAARQYTADRSSPVSSAPLARLGGDATLRQAMADCQSKTFAKARPALQRLAEQGNAQAYSCLAQALWEKSRNEQGPSSTSDRLAARDWALRAVDALPEDTEALLLAGQLTTMANQSPANVAKGVAMLKRAAAKGNGEAMHTLGLMYIMGGQIPKDSTQARHWFTEAANTGRADDMYNLGLMDWRGEGLPGPDKARARQWWNKAASHGDARARQALAQEGLDSH
ncbi:MULTISPECIES: SEL1-like repeat protein [Rhodanobacter]|uniref:SEL1-like repeat protein n=1 Tax=Rhodanobacter TaxID=75309 RepID=UPI0004066935|nr:MULTISPECIES: SEL1-like repeat protein [Rhodanobacter]UJJ56257.1 SEL1-like repeat protein [Rhodanobacter thiooxydans]